MRLFSTAHAGSFFFENLKTCKNPFSEQLPSATHVPCHGPAVRAYFKHSKTPCPYGLSNLFHSYEFHCKIFSLEKCRTCIWICKTTCAKCPCQDLCIRILQDLFAPDLCRTTCARSLSKDVCIRILCEHLCKMSVSGALHQEPLGPLVQDPRQVSACANEHGMVRRTAPWRLAVLN